MTFDPDRVRLFRSSIRPTPRIVVRTAPSSRGQTPTPYAPEIAATLWRRPVYSHQPTNRAPRPRS
jgi:hypothetical protein